MTEPASSNVLETALASARALALAHGIASESLALSRTHGRVLAREVSLDGQRPLEAGQMLTPARVAVAAAHGVASLDVARRPTVAVFTIGDRLVPPGMQRADGQVYDATRELIMGLLRADGLEPTAWPSLPEDPIQIEIALRDAGCAFDLIVVCTPSTEGGAGAARQVVERFGQVCGHDVAAASGGPLLGHLDEACVLVLPDDAVPALGLYATVGRTLIDGLQGRREPRPQLRVLLTADAPGPSNPGGQGEWIPVRVFQADDGRMLAEPVNAFGDAVHAVVYGPEVDRAGSKTARAWILA